jgi:hypothetical protein
MTLEEFLLYYLCFIVSGSIVMMYSIFYPICYNVRVYAPDHTVLTPLGLLLSIVCFTTFCCMIGPGMLFLLSNRRVFIKSFVEGLLR